MLEELIHNLLKDIELDIKPSKLDPLTYLIDLAPDLSVTIKATDPGYYMQIGIDRVPERETETLFITLMEANLLGQGTGGGVLGISPNGNMIVLSKKILHDLTYQEFKEKMEEFVNYVEFWRMEIQAHTEKKKRPENA